MQLQDAVDLGIKALKAGLEQGQGLGMVSVGVIRKGEKFKILSLEETNKLIGNK